jgi:hypothetical protein
MVIRNKADLNRLSKDELWQVAVDKSCHPEIQAEALLRWMALDEQDYQQSIARMRRLLDQSYKSMIGPDDTVSSLA